MIKTSRQLKDLVRNKSGGDSNKAQIIIRNYIMERFLERVSLSPYKEKFILKGGMIISSMVGINNRSISIEIDDGIAFRVKSISDIMDEAEYPGIRAMLEATLENMRTPLKIDFSTGDVITPKEIEYEYKLMFENRSISILAYNTETILAEKLETVISRSTANTRLRDFYDLRILYDTVEIDYGKLKDAFSATSERRGSTSVVKNKYDVQTIKGSSITRKNTVGTILWRFYGYTLIGYKSDAGRAKSVLPFSFTKYIKVRYKALSLYRTKNNGTAYSEWAYVVL